LIAGEGVEKIFNNYEKTKDNDSSGRRNLSLWFSSLRLYMNASPEVKKSHTGSY